MINQTEDIYKRAHAQLKRKYSIFLVLMTKRKQNKKTLIYIYWIYLILMAVVEGLEPSRRINRPKSLANSPLHQLE